MTHKDRTIDRQIDMYVNNITSPSWKLFLIEQGHRKISLTLPDIYPSATLSFILKHAIQWWEEHSYMLVTYVYNMALASELGVSRWSLALLNLCEFLPHGCVEWVCLRAQLKFCYCLQTLLATGNIWTDCWSNLVINHWSTHCPLINTKAANTRWRQPWPTAFCGPMWAVWSICGACACGRPCWVRWESCLPFTAHCGSVQQQQHHNSIQGLSRSWLNSSCGNEKGNSLILTSTVKNATLKCSDC